MRVVVSRHWDLADRRMCPSWDQTKGREFNLGKSTWVGKWRGWGWGDLAHESWLSLDPLRSLVLRLLK